MESKTPPDSKPPAPQPSEPGPWISPRLREKLGDPEPGAPREGPAPWVGIVLAVLVIGGGAALFVTMRTGAARQKVEAERAAAEKIAAATADSIANVAKFDSLRVEAAASALADSMAGRGKWSPEAKQAAAAALKAGAAARTAAAGGSSKTGAGTSAPTPAADDPAAAPKVVEKGPFGLDVGTFLAEDRAVSELARLSAAAGLKGKVVMKVCPHFSAGVERLAAL